MQLSKEKMTQLYPKKSDKVYFLIHALNEEDCIDRCLSSVVALTDNIVVLIDDRTTDKTEEIAKQYGAITQRFKWKHSFSRAKNQCLKVAMGQAGLEFGDWVLVMGSDFELQPHTIPEIQEFVKDEGNFFAQFEVPEFHKEGEGYVDRRRKLLWRHHPLIHWDRLVHEEVVNSAYTLTGIGRVHGTATWKELPVLGGKNGMIHYGFHEDGGEDGTLFWYKKAYYNILLHLYRIMRQHWLPDTDLGMLETLGYAMGRPVADIGKAIGELVEDYLDGEIPMGLTMYAPDEDYLMYGA